MTNGLVGIVAGGAAEGFAPQMLAQRAASAYFCTVLFRRSGNGGARSRAHPIRGLGGEKNGSNYQLFARE